MLQGVRLLLHQAAAELSRATTGIQERCTLPVASVAWLEQGSCEVNPELGIEGSLCRLKTELQAVAEQVASCQSGMRSPHDLHEQICAIMQKLAEYETARLARAARHLHSYLYGLCSELLGSLRASSASNAAANELADVKHVGEDAFALELSREQCAAVEHPKTLFLQGRSGTGKTLVLVQRILSQRRKAYESHGAGNIPSQMFITKSSMLRDEVSRQLDQAGCKVSNSVRSNGWPRDGVFCVTWDQFVGHLIGQRSTIGFRDFMHSFWPALSLSRFKHLHAQLVWTEFNSRLRPFGPKCLSGLTLSEYLEDDLTGFGVRLTHSDQHAIYKMFCKYMQLKGTDGRRLDDVDVAALLSRTLCRRSRLDELYVDEVQDFGPAQLMVLLQLCGRPDGVNMAGDTCQTINPGSAFIFQDLVAAFRKRWKSSEATKPSTVQSLHYNYRCAPGIASWASSVTRLLLQRFPHCADHIEEHTLDQPLAELPLVLQIAGIDPSQIIMGTGVSRVTTIDLEGFAILVRDDTTRVMLRNDGVQGTILTIQEAKGLEFDFVIICGFLGGCLYGSTLGALALDDSDESHLAVFAAEDADGQGRFHKFSAEFYTITTAIHELKLLYTAITRARFGCAILEFELHKEMLSPLVHRWKQEALIEHLSGMQEYVSRASPCNVRASSCSDAKLHCCPGLSSASVHSCPKDSDDEAISARSDGSSESSSHARTLALPDMIQWLDAEFDSRAGKEHRKARSALRKEMTRLESDKPVNPSFCAEFHAAFGLPGRLYGLLLCSTTHIGKWLHVICVYCRICMTCVLRPC